MQFMIALSKHRMLLLAILVILMALALTLFSMAHSGLLGHQLFSLTNSQLAGQFGN